MLTQFVFLFVSFRDVCPDEGSLRQFEESISRNITTICSDGRFVPCDKPYILVKSGTDQNANVQSNTSETQLKALKYILNDANGKFVLQISNI